MLNIRENALHLIMPYVTVNLLSRVSCLGQNGKIRGTGFAVEVDGKQYMVTANHVAKASQYKPQILMESWDSTFNWETIGKDEDNDVAVLAADRQLCHPIEIQIETGKITFGQTGYALGFPMDYGTDIFGRLEPEGDDPSHPMPMAAPTTFYGGGNPQYYWGGAGVNRRAHRLGAFSVCRNDFYLDMQRFPSSNLPVTSSIPMPTGAPGGGRGGRDSGAMVRLNAVGGRAGFKAARRCRVRPAA